MSESANLIGRAKLSSANLKRGLLGAVGPLILVAEIFAAIVIAYYVARVAWIGIEPGGSVLGAQPLRDVARQDSAKAQLSSFDDLSLLISTDPFSRSSLVAEQVQAVPTTKLNFQLKGVRASANGTGVAMIVMPNNRLSTFAPGETILDGVVLDRIYGDRVTLRKDGRVEALLMASGADRLSVLSSPGDATPKISAGAGTSDPLISTTATDFLTNLVINPVHRGQDFIGYEIGNRGDADLLERSGLQSGDIIVAVDGISVGSSSPDELAMKLSSLKKVRLRIDRDGRQIDQTFTLPENP